MKTKTTAAILSIIALATTGFAQSRLANLSTRGFVGTGDYVLIAGGIIVGNADKQIVARAIGPSLNAYLADALQDPVLEIYDRNGTIIARNDDWWEDQNAYLIQSVGLAPADDRESAIYGVVPPGSYTAVVRGYNDSVGIALVEIYDLYP